MNESVTETKVVKCTLEENIQAMNRKGIDVEGADEVEFVELETTGVNSENEAETKCENEVDVECGERIDSGAMFVADDAGLASAKYINIERINDVETRTSFNIDNVIDNIRVTGFESDKENEEITDPVHAETDDYEKKITIHVDKDLSAVTEKKRTECDSLPVHKCPTCHKRFSCKRYLVQHVSIHADLPRNHACTVCYKQFKMKHHLSRHLLTHGGQALYNCAACDKSYVEKTSLKKHLSSHHVDRHNFACELCGEKFVAKWKLESHILSHYGTKPNMTCDVCGKEFLGKRSFRNHLLVHAKLAPYACYACDKAFCDKIALTEHMRVHTGEKPYACDICAVAFSTKSNQLRHRKSHFRTPRCRRCKSEFEDERQLKLHSAECISVHECEKCGWRFNKASNLTRHLKTHTRNQTSPTNAKQ